MGQFWFPLFLSPRFPSFFQFKKCWFFFFPIRIIIFFALVHVLAIEFHWIEMKTLDVSGLFLLDSV